MLLVKKTTLIPKKMAANRRNASLSRDAATAEGNACIGAAQFHYGFYPKGQETQKDVKNGDRSGDVYENTRK